MNMYKAMIGLWILISVVLVISNMVNPTQAFIIIWMGKTYTLAMIGIATWVMMGFWIHGFMNSGAKEEDDTYKF